MSKSICFACLIQITYFTSASYPHWYCLKQKPKHVYKTTCPVALSTKTHILSIALGLSLAWGAWWSGRRSFQPWGNLEKEVKHKKDINIYILCWTFIVGSFSYRPCKSGSEWQKQTFYLRRFEDVSVRFKSPPRSSCFGVRREEHFFPYSKAFDYICQSRFKKKKKKKKKDQNSPRLLISASESRRSCPVCAWE